MLSPAAELRLRLDNAHLLVPNLDPVVKHYHIASVPPELLSPLRTLEQVKRFQAENNVAARLVEVLSDPLGFYLFKLFLGCHDQGANLISFLEDVVAFKMTASSEARATM